MLVNDIGVDKRVKFISYSGRFPNLCSGTLVLEIDGARHEFNYANACSTSPRHNKHDSFWSTGGGLVGYDSTYQGEWLVRLTDIPSSICIQN